MYSNNILPGIPGGKDMTETRNKRINKQYIWNLTRFTLIVVFLTLYFGYPLLEAYRHLCPQQYPIGNISPADLGMEYEDVTLHTEDGFNLYGWYIPSQNGAAVIMVHGFNGNRTGNIYHAQLLAENGYGVLLYDTRRMGESEGDIYAMGWLSHLDVFASLDYLEAQQDVEPGRIGILGLSAGGRTALRASENTDRISAVIAEGPGLPTFQDWMLGTDKLLYLWAPGIWTMYEVLELASGIHNPEPLSEKVQDISPTPLLLIAAGADRLFCDSLYDLAGEPKQYWRREDDGHIDSLFTHTEKYRETVLPFLENALLDR